MSTLSVVNIQNATNILGPSVGALPSFQDSTGTEYGRLCRAFVNFNGTGAVSTNQTIRASFNVSTVFKNGTGDYTINLTNALPDANYSIFTTAQNNRCSGMNYSLTTPTASLFRVVYAVANTLANSDETYCFVSVFR